MIFIDNKYTKYYYSIINHAKARVNGPDIYVECHHIIPESFFINRSRKGPAGWVEGNPEDKSNKVNLTAREHFICHILLLKMTSGPARSKMANALVYWAGKNIKSKKIKMTSRIYALIKHELSKANSGEGNPMWGRTHTDEVKSRLALIPSQTFGGKTYEDIYGEERAKEIRAERSSQRKDYLKHNPGIQVGKNNSNAKSYKLIDPVGAIHIINGNLRIFCKQNSLDVGSVISCAKGRRPNYKGWSISYDLFVADSNAALTSLTASSSPPAK